MTRVRIQMLATVVAIVAGTLTGASAATTTWFVRAGATPGDGTLGAPFGSLAPVEAASAPGDTIIVLASVDALNGGIALKPHQRLIGDGPSVVGASSDALPRITNTDPSRHDGDAVQLADGTEVSNIAVRGPSRGGIYGLDVTGVDVHGNDVSGHNTSCAVGFQVLPIVAPSNVPGVGVPFGVRLPVYGDKYVLDINNGWAGIMVDATHVAGEITIRDNVVHDAACGDGIDVRLRGNADLTAHVLDNVVTRLAQGHFAAQPASVGVDSLMAMGFQTDDASRLFLDAVGNSQTFIGSEGSDCEGLFADLSGSSTLTARIDRNTFAHGIGGTSCNAVEMITGNGNPTADMRVGNSTFEDNPGDMFEAGNMGVGSKMRLELDNVVIRNSTIRGGNSGAIPFNIGDCLLAGNSGSGNVTSVIIRNSELTGCNNGISFASNAALGNGLGPDGSMKLDVRDSRIHGNDFYNVWVQNATVLNDLSVRFEGTDLSEAGDTAIAIDQRTGVALLAALDLGGGVLGSPGGNCLSGGTKHDAETMRFTVAARGNWWGTPGGPAAGRTAATPPLLSSIDAGSPLAAPPPACA
jgi:hypothetical protein